MRTAAHRDAEPNPTPGVSPDETPQTTPREVAPEVASEAASAAASDATSEAATHVASEAVEDGAASEAPAVPGTATEGANDATLLSRAVCDGDMRRFECSICLDVLLDPRQCRSGHAFCLLPCLATHLESSEICPVCRVPIDFDTVGRNLLLEDQLNAMQFQCKNADCPATLSRAELDAHEQRCPYRLVQCECRSVVVQHMFREHVEECQLWAGRCLAQAQVEQLEADLLALQAEAQHEVVRRKQVEGFLLFARRRTRDVAIERDSKDARIAALTAERDAAQFYAHHNEFIFSTMLDDIMRQLRMQPNPWETPEQKTAHIMFQLSRLMNAMGQQPGVMPRGV
eukprot:EG_transcript_11086